MSATNITAVTTDRFDEFNRFLERCYGFSEGFFVRAYPDVYRPEDPALACCMVVERDDRIVSHVGAYPIEMITGSVPWVCGGIGGVATLPEERGQGHMSRLLQRSIARMRDLGYPLSVLWGDQQRYGLFDYETCGVSYNLKMSQRSLNRAGIQPLDVEERPPQEEETVRRVADLFSTLAHRTARPHLRLQLGRPGIHVYLGADGYLITGDDPDTDELVVWEIVSPRGQEAGLLAGAMACTGRSRAHVKLEPGSGERGRRLMETASTWTVSPQGMLRIIDWPGLLATFRPLLAERARELAPFRLAVGCRFTDRLEVATLDWDGQHLTTGEGKQSSRYTEMPARRLVGMLAGGPHADRADAGPLHAMLPLPINVPVLDHV